MCIIVVVKPGLELPDSDVMNLCWDNNPDGGGLMYVHDNSIVVKKSMDKDEFFTACNKAHATYGSDSPLVIHMRYATHGEVNLDNCHPFVLSDEYALAHNGTIHNTTKGLDKDSETSDTRVFCEEIMGGLPEGWFDSFGIEALLASYIGQSRMCIMDNEGTLLLLNEEKWINEEGLLYSCDWYKRKRPLPAAKVVVRNSVSSNSKVSNILSYMNCELCGGKRTEDSKYGDGLVRSSLSVHILERVFTCYDVCDDCLDNMAAAINVQADMTSRDCYKCGNTVLNKTFAPRFLLERKADYTWDLAEICYKCYYGNYTDGAGRDGGLHGAAEVVVNRAFRAVFELEGNIIFNSKYFSPITNKHIDLMSKSRLAGKYIRLDNRDLHEAQKCMEEMQATLSNTKQLLLPGVVAN